MESIKTKSTYLESKSKDALLARQLQEKEALRKTIRRYHVSALMVVVLTIGIAFLRPAFTPHLFVSFFLFLLIQFLATKKYIRLAKKAQSIRILQGGDSLPIDNRHLAWKIPAGVAVRDFYFLLFGLFSAAFLLHAFLYPAPASSFQQFLRQVSIGPISGTAFLWVIGLLLLFYISLFFTGILYTREVNYPEQLTPVGENTEKKATFLQEVWIIVKTFDGDEIYLQGHRLPHEGKQPLILFPGFYQNGFVYDLSDSVSLTRYLWAHDFDIWMIHPRGTAQSDGRKKKTSLDDFASDDIPAVINHVHSKTGIKPVYVGHSQGGIAALISMMGLVKKSESTVVLSDTAKTERQQMLQGLVTMGSCPDFAFSKASWLKNFVKEGVIIKRGKRHIRLLRSQTLLNLPGRLNFVGTPVSFPLRTALARSSALRLFYFPLTVGLHFISRRSFWEFLYHIPNVAPNLRTTLFYKTMDGTFSPILRQFHAAVDNESMKSIDTSIDYSEHYSRLTLPVSIVAMEHDSLADPVMMKQKMFDKISSKHKFFTLWKDVGHEDHFANTTFFPWVLASVKNVCQEESSG